jgi:hypothetical protein
MTDERLTEAQINIARLENEISHLQRSMQSMSKQLDEIQAMLAEARGGWKAMMWMAGAAASAGALISWAITNLTWRGP